LDALLGMSKLYDLNISGNGLADINFLSGLKQHLTRLNLSNNTLEDLSLLADFTNLYSLDIANNQVNDLKFLETQTNLGYMNLANNDISDLSSLRKNVENYSTHFDLGMDYPYDFDTRYKKVIDISNNALDLSSVSVDLETLKQLSNLTVLLAKPIVNALDESTEIVTGQAEPNLPVTVKIGTQLYTSTVLIDGRFEVSIPRQKAGTIINVTVTDRMGNESEPTSVEVVNDITPPAAPKVTVVTNVDTVLKGTTEAGADVIITVGNTVVGSGTADESGMFNIMISQQNAGTTLVITAKDAAGNESKTTVVTKKANPVKVQLNGNDFTNGFFGGGTTYVHWKALDVFKTPYTNKGNGDFVIDGRAVKGINIEGDFYIRWSDLAPGKLTYKTITGGYNFIYLTTVKLQLNGKAFTDGFFKDGTTYVHWKALETLKIPFMSDGKGTFTIEGRVVKGESINGTLYIRWNELSPGKITYKKIEGGFNFIYPTSVKVQFNGQAFMDGYNKEGIVYVNWKALEMLKIPYTTNGKGSFTIEGRAVQAESMNGSLYIRWNELSPGRITYKQIEGGFNFIYPTSLKVQLNGQAFRDGFLKEGKAYLHWAALETLMIPYTYDGKGSFTIEGRKVQGEAIQGAYYIRWDSLSPGTITYQKITNGFNFINNK
ncbi:Ig-like domain-containing protein, partial [Neobacillus niacini]|uniref:Ig-like domain-containing protein n=1 Tax=Neobacillus niacini TaxID=86668 RepID=UPI002FFD7A9E